MIDEEMIDLGSASAEESVDFDSFADDTELTDNIASDTAAEI